MSYANLITEDRRLVLLRLLAESEGYSANEYLLATALPGFGHNASHDRVRTDLDWLAEQDLVRVERPGEVYVATLTGRGADVAAGRARVAGVKRPLPGE
jgi:Fe2+ or Zn2+ uptake regulation protein